MRILFVALTVAVAGAAVIGLAVVLISANQDAARPEEIILRLSDLPAGYKIGDDSFCGPLSTEGMPASLASIFRSDPPKVCFRQFEQGSPAKPDLIDSGVLIFSSKSGAGSALAGFPDLAKSLSALLTLSDHPSPVQVGDESRTFLASNVNSQEVGVLIAWRIGAILQFVSVSGYSALDPLAYATDLASIQEYRAAEPAATQPSDMDDRSAALDRPNLAVPVYWLGVDFPGQGALPPLYLAGSEGPMAPGGGPGNGVQIDYSTTGGRGASVILTIWRLDSWRSFLGSQLGDLATVPPCGEPRVVELPDRRIEIHAPGELRERPVPTALTPGEPGQAQPQAIGGNEETQCPPGYVGHVYFEDAVVVINMAFCFTCTTPQGPHNSEEGIETVARALELR